jgi:hypothetical protein
VVPESERSLRLEIGHVLFIDLVGYSKLPIEEQKERLAQLTEIVLATAQVREAPNEQLVRLPTGDGETRVARAVVDVDERADTDPLYRTIHDILATTPGSESTVAQQWIWLRRARRCYCVGNRPRPKRSRFSAAILPGGVRAVKRRPLGNAGRTTQSA